MSEFFLGVIAGVALYLMISILSTRLALLPLRLRVISLIDDAKSNVKQDQEQRKREEFLLTKTSNLFSRFEKETKK